MGINISPKQDMSYLFSGLGTSAANVASSNFLGEYASIKNGSYSKLMKAYYAKDSSASVKALAKNSQTKTDIDQKVLAKVQTATDALKETADQLLTTGSKSVFKKIDVTTTDANGIESTSQDYDRDKIYKAVNNFITDYNDVIESMEDVENTTLTNRVQSMVNSSIANLKLLNKVGISINGDSTLSIDKSSFEKADMSKVISLFQGNGSYGYQVSTQASMMNYAAQNASAKVNTYTGTGTYGNSSTGNLFNSYF